ncbi:MAG: M23 family metallopeptidase [Dehalococcoidia bacterium]|nr:M23 family metallopeptidase [Dehalococcoidia bacterium]
MRFAVGALLFALALSVAGCSDDGSAAQVTFEPVIETPPPVSATPTATSTPIPPPELVLSATTIPQAGAILVSLVGTVTSGEVTFLGRTQQLYQGSQSIYAFVGVAPDDPPGPQQLRVEFVLPNGTRGVLTQPIDVLAREWTLDEIEVPEDRTGLLGPGVAEVESAIIEAVYAGQTPEKLWTNGWLIPTDGAITTQFGEQRAYNGAPPSGHHTGVDIGADEGTPVVATNSGRVVLVRELSLHGNMIIVDHGGGVFSGYSHLSGFAVSEGQLVAAGDLLGYVGNTGLSTGAHLHWEMYVGGVGVDALRFVDGSNGF